MDFTWQDLVDYLLALSGAIPEESPSIHLLYEEDNLLIEKLWFRSKLLKQFLITSDVRTDTPALYLLNDETRLVFFVDTEDVLRGGRYDPDEQDWLLELDGEGDITIPQNSKLSGCFTPKGQIVFFQNESGLLQGIEIQDSTWELLNPTPAKPVEGTRHLVIRTANDNLYLFYIGRDKYIHYLVKGPETGEWQDNVLNSPILEKTIVNFMVIPDEDMKFETKILTTDSLIGIDKEGVLTEFGKVAEGKFTPVSGKECVIETIRLVKKGVKAIAGKAVKAKKT
ncbi:hypothetical protein EYR41_010027 [Orbilia oligospora]|uniref:Uncharacterized protein n=1 Tax=Orbilia oligospora TaxID=2813651 RepID=A0A7C8PQG5_ORBOL|nr:hypothetical protein TWF751_005426 [Orbilia oligospora]TGJ63944.1 hypothetical protein EYR41_010027 [Orbilia oligospora]